MSNIRNDKNKKRPYMSLAVQIPMVLAITVFVVIAIMCIVFGIVTFKNIDTMVQTQIENIADQNVVTVQKYVSGIEIYASSLGDSIMNYREMGKEKGEEAILEAMKEAVNSGKVFSAYYAFEPNAFFPDTPDGLSYYVYKSGNSLGVDILNDYDSYGSADYYVPARDKQITHITDPYVWECEDGSVVHLITLSTPIVDNGKFIGVSNCDVELSSLEGLEYSNGGYNSAYVTVNDSNKTYLANSANSSVVGETADFSDSIIESVTGGQRLLKSVKDNIGGKDSFAIFVPVKMTGTDINWVLTSIVHKDEVRAAVYQSLLIVAIIGIIGVAALVVISSIVVRRSLAPVKPLMKIAENVGEFRLSEVDDNYKYPNDEIGELAGTFTHMADNLKRIIEDLGFMLSVMSDGDFTVESTCPGNYVGDMRSALDSMNTIKSTLGRTLKDISVSAGKVSDNSTQISDGSQALAQGATEQAGSVEELSSTISSVNDKVQTNAANAEKASKIAMRTKDAITESNQEMYKLTSSMDEIEEASNKIQDVISIIDNIAFQTNILSLNAAIEAARAGQAGKGFAVVADEVGNLAKRSQEAAQSTSDLIQMVTEAVNNGKGITDDTADALEKVSGFADETNEMIGEISEASHKQADALDQISIGVGQISEVVQNNSSTAEQSAAASIELANEAKRLYELVERFKLP